ncbi:MarR family transcriptional regulator, 2-MHQ and catechol-resistance regulon repressor [Malonomonas rubra DSM 5091]|uniref:MarR family transcriptional regulator, 2-MHQ and catechol-resistance regulon repressor n=1 Tax=Malonomonas rubra DSM 5091 TaxID=1122189 RepID=A0A1M6IT46_MALRU|nr:MarR family transcriptional regulator [Malonomonas rubra]SHJ37598.1 MarR family transcriptional regulator, 2-MHQ and catechol-resistance regulon repressor [Malonomonas rubra DSM 5091]
MRKQPEKSQRQALNLYVKLMRATNRVTGDIHRHLAADKLTHSQFAVLEALYHLGPLSQGELGAKILRSNANLTTVVDSLEKKDLVRRMRAPEDRRRVTVTLTDAGEKLIGRVFPRHAKIVEHEFSVLSADEQEQLATLLKKLGKGK